MKYTYQEISVNISLSISEIDNLYYLISGNRRVDQRVKDLLLDNIKGIVKKYKDAVALDLRLYDATDEEEELVLSKEAHEFRHGEEERNVLWTHWNN